MSDSEDSESEYEPESDANKEDDDEYDQVVCAISLTSWRQNLENLNMCFFS